MRKRTNSTNKVNEQKYILVEVYFILVKLHNTYLRSFYCGEERFIGYVGRSFSIFPNSVASCDMLSIKGSFVFYCVV